MRGYIKSVRPRTGPMYEDAQRRKRHNHLFIVCLLVILVSSVFVLFSRC